jgi:hypothetical protein
MSWRPYIEIVPKADIPPEIPGQKSLFEPRLEVDYISMSDDVRERLIARQESQAKKAGEIALQTDPLDTN